jgi:DNA mismatch repair protein MutS
MEKPNNLKSNKKKPIKLTNKKTPTLTIYELYVKYHDEYGNKYGKDNTLVLMQVGSFYECYSTDNLGPNLINISKITGMSRGRKNKKEGSKVTISSPYFLGFPMVSTDKYVSKLIDENFTVVIVDQIPNFDKIGIKDGNPEERKVTQILTKGTYIENLDKKESNYIVCIYISHDDQTNFSPLMSVGLTGVDVSTGHIYIHEAYSNKYDPKFALDEASRFVKNLTPKEILIFYDDNRKSTKKESQNEKNIIMAQDKELILNYLDITEKSCRFSSNVDPKYHKLIVQNEILGLIYSDTKNMLSPIENLDLEKNIFTIISLVLLINFIYVNNKALLTGLEKPKQFFDQSHLVLGNNAIRQLDVLESSDKDTDDAKYKSLFHVVNQTSTALGERYLKDILLSPMTSINELNKIYDLTDALSNGLWKEFENLLDEIKDIERLQRKIELAILRPYELPFIVLSYEKILEIIDLINNNNTFKSKESKNLISTLLPEKNNVNQITKFITYCRNIFDMEELAKYNLLTDIKTSIFNMGIHSDLDTLKDKVDNSEDILESLRLELNNIIKKDTVKKINDDNLIRIKKNNREGHYLLVSKPRCLILKKAFETMPIIEINGIKIKTEDIKFIELENNIKIKFGSFNNESKNIKIDTEKTEFLNRKYYVEELKIINKNYNLMFMDCNKFITKLDYIKSNAKIAEIYNYVRPHIKEKSYGYVSASGLRHPLIERNIRHEYVPHDVTIGKKDLKGMLIYGINGAGKSVLMKAIGISIIMAQAGLFVPAKSFNFSPYFGLFARITGSDNIFRGWSSFTLEMVELNAILKRNGPKTLIIGDEVCRGTEHISGTAIVAASILELAETKSTFIFATHLHEIMELDEIKELTNIKSYHIFIKYDAKTDSFICDRILKEGSGDSVYGLEVARHIIQNTKFIDRANNIQAKLLKKYADILSGKVSRYNKNILVYKCNICGKQDDKHSHISPLETHHITFQKDCENGFLNNKSHIKKNHDSNLIVLCDDCHNKVHKGTIKIEGWKNTSKGNKVIVEQNT